ncbi:hypothetical protein KIPB_003255 [Kipferlia bialata]|uniref:Uncharacterized protein n=1 Tax=Kipferlia bialata TaxID=797122 RepID=A0A9K3GGJ5_9EUKA|nr:hypothetical protein KIPB_003255 [Kipferlia bialata]|eukprot:g3255.t1
MLMVVWVRRAQTYLWQTIPAHICMMATVLLTTWRGGPVIGEPINWVTVLTTGTYFGLINLQTFLASATPKPQFAGRTLGTTQPWLFPVLAGWSFILSDIVVITMVFLLHHGLLRDVVVMIPYYGGLALVVGTTVFFPTADEGRSPAPSQPIKQTLPLEGVVGQGEAAADTVVQSD